MKKFKELETILLRLGGKRVAEREESDLRILIERGKSFSTKKIAYRKGVPCGCHKNSVDLHLHSPEDHKIVTGWRLSDDEIWRQHSWIFDKVKGRILETTVKGPQYFGVLLTPAESDIFVCYNK